MVWEGLLEEMSLELSLNGRKEPALEKRFRQKDSKCKGPAARTSTFCIKNGRKAGDQGACRGKGLEGDGEESAP